MASGSAATTTCSKILVAVHGIGDQFNFATIQSVVYRLLAYYDKRSPVPLGTFHQIGSGEGPRVLMSPPFTGPAGIGFAEVYWANIPREVVKEGYTLEEAKKWAKTITARVRAKVSKGALREGDYVLIETVLEELIDTVAVLERLCFMAEKAGVFKVNLQRILLDFLDDVQIVTEFPSYRKKILDEFDTVLKAVVEQDAGAEIYLVAHSEGTVVTLAGLLRAMTSAPRPAWLDRIRGIMTIGSPLDTHVLLWPDLWEAPKPESSWKPGSAIPWHNYYEHGDPIGDSLTSTDNWLKTHLGDGRFEISNFPFSRYYFPGKAHVDYWNDEAVFGHFIQEVIRPPDGPGPPRARPQFDRPPTKRLPQITSYVAPYGIIAALFLAAMFVLYRTVITATAFEPTPTSLEVLRDVTVLGLLLAGITVAVRIFRLTTMWRWRLVGVGVFLLAEAVYVFRAASGLRETLADAFGHLGVPVSLRGWAIPMAAALIVVACASLGRTAALNRWGIRVLLVAGGVVILGLVVTIVATDQGDRGPVWPVLVGSVAFLYLWWLAALLFDLVFVWHRYIRHSIALRNLRAMRPSEGRPRTTGEARQPVSGGG